MNMMILAFLILAVTIILFIWEPVPIVVTSIGASILYAYVCGRTGTENRLLHSLWRWSF